MNMDRHCKQCGTKLKKQKTFCSYKCVGLSRKGKYFFNRSGLKHTDKTKLKMKKARVGKKPALGMIHTKKSKERIKTSVIKARGCGGKFKTIEGYIKINCTNIDHPYKDNQGYVLEHRLVTERILGRFLLPEEVIHHINKKITDNRPENLYITSPSGHQKIHKEMRTNKSFILISNIDTYEKVS